MKLRMCNAPGDCPRSAAFSCSDPGKDGGQDRHRQKNGHPPGQPSKRTSRGHSKKGRTGVHPGGLGTNPQSGRGLPDARLFHETFSKAPTGSPRIYSYRATGSAVAGARSRLGELLSFKNALESRKIRGNHHLLNQTERLKKLPPIRVLARAHTHARQVLYSNADATDYAKALYLCSHYYFLMRKYNLYQYRPFYDQNSRNLHRLREDLLPRRHCLVQQT
jgi:hypothetical protein